MLACIAIETLLNGRDSAELRSDRIAEHTRLDPRHTRKVLLQLEERRLIRRSPGAHGRKTLVGLPVDAPHRPHEAGPMPASTPDRAETVPVRDDRHPARTARAVPPHRSLALAFRDEILEEEFREAGAAAIVTSAS